MAQILKLHIQVSVMFNTLMTHYQLCPPQMYKHMNTYKTLQFLSIRCSVALSFKGNWKKPSILHTTIEPQSYQICFFPLISDVLGFPDCISTFSVKVQFSFPFIPFSLKYRNMTDPQINSRLYILPLQTYPFNSCLNPLVKVL